MQLSRKCSKTKKKNERKKERKKRYVMEWRMLYFCW